MASIPPWQIQSRYIVWERCIVTFDTPFKVHTADPSMGFWFPPPISSNVLNKDSLSRCRLFGNQVKEMPFPLLFFNISAIAVGHTAVTHDSCKQTYTDIYIVRLHLGCVPITSNYLLSSYPVIFYPFPFWSPHFLAGKSYW